MNITVLGCGNAFSKLNFNQSFLLEENGRKMLIDCGFQTGNALQKANIKESEIDDIFISHAHADHIGYLEAFAFLRYDWMNKPTHYSQGGYAPRLITNSHLMNELWEHSLKGGLSSMEGFDATLETFFEPLRVEPNKSFDWQGWKCELIQQVHVMTGSVIMSTFGLFMSRNNKSIYFTTDSQHCSPKQMEVFYKKADLIFQDCECVGVVPSNRQFLFSSGVHANYGQLAGYETANSIKLSDNIKNKMWLSHYQDFVSKNEDFQGNTCFWNETAENDGFRGFLRVGDKFDV